MNNNGMKIYVVGDSISIHYGPYLKQYLSGWAQYSRKEGEDEAMLDLDTPQGANGGDSSMVLAFLRALSGEGGIDADIMLLNCGLHDMRIDKKTAKHQISLEQYENNLKSIIDVARGMVESLVWIRTTPFDEKNHNSRGLGFDRLEMDCISYNEVADRVMAQAEVPTIDLHTFTRNLGPDLCCDHVHFRESIREKQAACIAGWLHAWTTT